MSIDTSQCQRVAGGFAGERASCPHHREGLSGSTGCLGCAKKWATGCKASWDGNLGRSLGIWVLGADGEDYRAVLLCDIHSEAAAQRRQLLLKRQAASHPVLDLARRQSRSVPRPPSAPRAARPACPGEGSLLRQEGRERGAVAAARGERGERGGLEVRDVHVRRREVR